MMQQGKEEVISVEKRCIDGRLVRPEDLTLALLNKPPSWTV